MSILILSILKVSEKGNRLYCMNYLGNTDILKGFLWTFVIVCLNYSNDLGISFTKSVHGRKCWAWWGQGLFNLISDDTEVFFWVTHKSSELARKIWVATPKSPRPSIYIPSSHLGGGRSFCQNIAFDDNFLGGLDT